MVAIARDPRLSLRSLSLASIIAFGVLWVMCVTALVWMSRVAWRSSRDVERDTQSVDVTYEFDGTLWEHHRLGNLWMATRAPELRTVEAELESNLRASIVKLKGYLDDPVEHRLFDQLDEQVTAYVTTRTLAEQQGLRLEEAVRSITPLFENTMMTSAKLRERAAMNRRASLASAERALRAQWMVALTSGLLLLLGLAVVAIAVHQLVIWPIQSLHAAVERARMGDPGERASGGPLYETGVLAERFNEMTDAIAQRRRDQLTFLAAVAHDLRNPLAGLKMIVQNLERDPGGTTPARLQRLDRQVDRFTRMVGDLLDATRIEAGNLELRFEDFDLRDAARAMVDLYAPTTTIHQVTLKAPERPLIEHGDPLRVEQVISNLLSNAIKYSPEGGPVEVSLSSAHGEAVVAVTDCGVGITPEELPNLFLPFHRRPSTADVSPGVGLGLSIVRRIVLAHGGRIDVESTPNVGSTFRVHFPLRSDVGRERPVA